MTNKAALERQKVRGDLIKRRRVTMGLTQAQLGKLVGVTQAAIYNLEAGKTRELKGSHLVKLFQLLHIEPHLLALEDISEAIDIVKAVRLYAIEKDYPLTDDQIYKVVDLLCEIAEFQEREVTQEYIDIQLPGLIPVRD